PPPPQLPPLSLHDALPISIGRGRFHVTRAGYEQLAGRDGGLFVGSPSELVDKILYEHELLGQQRFLAQLDVGGLPYPQVARAIEDRKSTRLNSSHDQISYA